MKVMIVDDDATTLRIVGAVLQSEGHDVIERDNAIGTTLAILREKPDVVILDVRMPGLAGDKLASLIGQGNKSSPIVILHSSLPANEVKSLAQLSGAAGFVPKGVAPRDFIEQFDMLVAAARRGRTRKHA
jgi:DNA-binding response OmpR family regulator